MLKALRPLFPYFRKYRRGLLFGALTVLLLNGFAAMFPKVFGRISQELMNGSMDRRTLAMDALIVIGIYAGKGLFLFLTRKNVIGISRDIEFDLRNDLFAHLESLSYDYFQRTRTGDIMARCTNDLNAVRMMLGPAIMYSANTLVFSVFALFFMFRISPKLTLYAVLPLPIVSFLIQYFGRKIHERFERIQASFSDISARAQENFAGVRVVRAYVQEEAEIASFGASNNEYIARSLPLIRLMGMLWPSLELTLGLGIAMVLFFGARQVLSGQIPFRDFIAYVIYVQMLTWPIIAFGFVINLYQRGTASLLRIQEIMNEPPRVNDSHVAPDLAGKSLELRGEIRFQGLTFSFDAGPSAENNGHSRNAPVLENISLHVPAGTSLAIVGPTGSGKTTLLSLIPRIYDTARGMVLIDGRPVTDYPVAELRRNIGFVPQETFLFSDTLRANITFGTESATDEQVHAAADGASIAADIESFPEQYNTIVGERGITLSGGQKQRTAIARAIIRDPRILILDDALSSVDTYTEERILNHLREVMRGRTTILISHRVSTVRNADKIAVLHHGSIVEYGTHDELIARDGYYTDLYNKQMLEEELASV